MIRLSRILRRKTTEPHFHPITSSVHTFAQFIIDDVDSVAGWASVCQVIPLCNVFFFKVVTMCSPHLKQGESWDFPGPVIKQNRRSSKGEGSIAGQEAKTPHTKSEAVILITNSIKTWNGLKEWGRQAPILERSIVNILIHYLEFFHMGNLSSAPLINLCNYLSISI